MNVLLVNPSYPQTFWSFERVLRMTKKKALVPPLGLLTVAGLLPDDWQIDLVDMAFQTIRETQWDTCDIVMITGMAVQYSGMMAVIREAKKRNKVVVVGGPLVFHVPEQAVQEGADIVVLGEAEVTMPAVLESLKNRESKVIIRADRPADLAETPTPKFDLLDMNSYVDMAVQFSRGCPFRCEFCDVTLMFGRRVRTKPPRQILNELETLYSLGWRRLVFFVDDNFIGNVSMTKKLLRELVPWMEKRGRPFDFSTQASVNMAADDTLLDSMFRAGFFRVFLGIETTDRDCLLQANKRQNAVVDLDAACQKINRAGFQIIAGCILGFDGEQPGAGQRLVAFANRNKIPEIFLTALQVGPGTDLYKRMEREGRLRLIDFEHVSNQTGLVNFVPTRPLIDIVEELIHVYEVLYERKAFVERAFEHYRRMSPPKVKRTLRMPQLSELRALAITLFRQGLVSQSRRTFWKFLLKALWRYPDRIDRFLTACVVSEHYYDFRDIVCREIRGQLEHLDEAWKTEVFSPPSVRSASTGRSVAGK